MQAQILSQKSDFCLKWPVFIQKQDPRHFQILFLSGFLLYGIFFLDWAMNLPQIAFTIGSCVAVQWASLAVLKKDLSGLKSALISGLGLCLLLKTNDFSTLFLASAFTILGKFLIRHKGKHVFNPTLLGIVLTLMLTGKAWVSPGQWGNGGFVLFLFGVAGMFMLMRVGRLDTSLIFLLAFGFLEWLIIRLWLGWPADHWMLRMSNGTLLLFAAFMITDPRTTPNHRLARVIFATGAALFTVLISTALELRWIPFSLPIWFKLHTAPLWALFIISPFTPLLDKIFTAKVFKWTNS